MLYAFITCLIVYIVISIIKFFRYELLIHSFYPMKRIKQSLKIILFYGFLISIALVFKYIVKLQFFYYAIIAYAIFGLIISSLEGLAILGIPLPLSLIIRSASKLTAIPCEAVYHSANYPHTKYELDIPQKIKIDNSCIISLILYPDYLEAKLIDEKKEHFTLKYDIFSLKRDLNESHLIEIELQASAMNVDGEKKQSQIINSKPLYFIWNCSFSTSGRHTIALIIRYTYKENSEIIEVIKRNIKVTKLFGLTANQMLIVTGIATLVSAIYLTLNELMNSSLIKDIFKIISNLF